MEMSTPRPPHTHVLKEVESIKELLNECQKNVDEIKKHHCNILSPRTTPYERLQHEHELAQLMAKMKLSTDILRDRLETMEEIGDGEDGLTSKEHFSLISSFFNVTSSYKQDQINFRDEYKLRLKHHLGAGDANFTSDEIEDMLEKGDFPQRFQQQKKVDVETPDEHKKHLEEAEKRHQHLKTLNESIAELHYLLEKVHSIVKEKRIDIDNAQEDAQMASEMAYEGALKLNEAARFWADIRRQKWLLLLFFTFCAVVIGLVVYALTPEQPPELPKPMPKTTGP